MRKWIFAAIVVIVAISAVQASDMQTAIREADKKLKANNFLLDDEIDKILEAE